MGVRRRLPGLLRYLRPDREREREPTTATITFLRENDTPVVQTVPVARSRARRCMPATTAKSSAAPSAIIVEATRPVIAERAMYFASLPGRFWAGGHANTGIAAPSTSWFHAEGATGRFFNTFILLSNPQTRPRTSSCASCSTRAR